MKTSPFLIALTAFALLTHVSQAAIKYIVTDLGALGSYSEAYGINASGQIIGENPSTGHAFLYQNGTITDLNSLIDPASGWALNQAKAINASGQIVGFGSGAHHGAYLYHNGTVTDLGTFPSAASLSSVSEARGLNDAGQVVGDAWTSTGDTHAFFYSSGVMTDLGTLGGNESRAYGINASGQIVGSAKTSSGDSHAFLYQNNTMSDLGTLGGTRSEALAINEGGQIVGFATVADGGSHPFIYENGVMTDLGTFSPRGVAYAINSKGQVVGSDDGAAFIYENGVITDLNTLIDPASGWYLEYAHGINDAGQIVGYGHDGSHTHALLLTPGTPTPKAVAPSVVFSGKKKITTGKSTVVIKGKASGSVSSVTYRVGSKGAYKKAAGTNVWKFKAKLKFGKNIVSIVAHGPGGASQPIKITVIRKPHLN